jgi:hypothetical protein
MLAQPNEAPEILQHRLKDAGVDPAPRLLLHGGRPRNMRRHLAPLRAGFHRPPRDIEDFPEITLPRRGVLTAQGQVRRDKRTLLIAHITQIAGSSERRRPQLHPLSYPVHVSQVHNAR